MCGIVLCAVVVVFGVEFVKRGGFGGYVYGRTVWTHMHLHACKVARSTGALSSNEGPREARCVACLQCWSRVKTYVCTSAGIPHTLGRCDRVWVMCLNLRRPRWALPCTFCAAAHDRPCTESRGLARQRTGLQDNTQTSVASVHCFEPRVSGLGQTHPASRCRRSFGRVVIYGCSSCSQRSVSGVVCGLFGVCRPFWLWICSSTS